MSYRADNQVIDTHTQTDTQIQAMTLPEGQNWPRVKMGEYLTAICFMVLCINPLNVRPKKELEWKTLFGMDRQSSFPVKLKTVLPDDIMAQWKTNELQSSTESEKSARHSGWDINIF